MKSFASYAASRNLSEFIFENDINVDNFCESVLNFYAEDKSLNEQNLNELVQKLARGVSGLFGGAGGMAGDAVRGAGGAIGSAARAVGGAISGAARAVGGAAQAAGQYVGDKYEAGRRAEAIRQINDRVKGLESALVSLGLDKSQVSDFLGKINAHMLNAVKSGKLGAVQKSSDVRKQAIQSYKQKGMAQNVAFGAGQSQPQSSRSSFDQSIDKQMATAGA